MMKRWLLCLILIVVTLFILPNVFAAMSCSVKSSCAASEIDAGGMSSGTDAHYEQFNESTYSARICCDATLGTMTNSCDIPAATFARTSSATDAHVEQNNFSTSGYDPVCMRPIDFGITVTYTTDNGSCAGADTCMFTLSSGTDAHIATCNGTSYNTSICLTESATSDADVPEFTTIIGMIAALSILSVGFVMSRRRKKQ